MLGRGGQGVKTAAHIVGTAAFLAGFQVQDQPLYGAERRGAPITALVRISDQPILERGHESDASILLIADDSLLEDPSSLSHYLPTEGLIFVNSSSGSDYLKSRTGAKCSVMSLDLTGMVTREFGRSSSLSAALAGAVSGLLGLPLARLEDSVKHELQKLGMASDITEENLALAKTVFDAVRQFGMINLGGKTTSVARNSLVELSYHGPAVSACTISATGNTMERKVGVWSQTKPVINYDKCTKCTICFVYCPDSAITLDNEGFPRVNYDQCKGCDICHKECPVKAISIVERGPI